MTTQFAHQNTLYSTPAPSPTSISTLAKLIYAAVSTLKERGTFLISCQWIRPQPNTGASRFFTVTLADSRDSSIAIQGIIWDAQTIQTLLRTGQEFGIDLADRTAQYDVMLDVTIDCWPKKATPYLRIHRLNVVGMKGLKQQAREAAIQQLTDRGLLRANASKPWTKPALRLAIITKPGSAACEDVLSILRHSGYRFQPTLIPVNVQGTHAQASLVAAFQELTRRRHEFDLALLVRGGGSELDLHAYDLLPVAEAVAQCPLPVITGLGHHTDHSVCDVVAARAVETPTAAAQAIVNDVRQFHQDLLHTTGQTLNSAHSQIQSLHALVQKQTHTVLHHTLSLVRLTQQALVTTSSRILTVQAAQMLLLARRQLTGTLQVIHHGMMDRIVTPAHQSLRRVPTLIHLHLQTQLGRTRSAIQSAVAYIEGLNPTRILELGFSLLTTRIGHPITNPNSLTARQRITIHLRHHQIHATITSIKDSRA
ncbi:MAG: exodeoxyribonuclease VII large subunit [Nitrospira sp.]